MFMGVIAPRRERGDGLVAVVVVNQSLDRWTGQVAICDPTSATSCCSFCHNVGGVVAYNS